MKSIRFAFGSFLFLVLYASTSLAQVQRTFVSGLGYDGNACSRLAPCRTFARSISQTNAGGEVIVLDSAGYGPATITQAVSIISGGVYSGISVFSGDGIDVNAGVSDTVILRGLTVNNQGSAGNGIVFNSAGLLHIENCVVNGFSSGAGVLFNGPGKLEINDSTIRGNGIGFLTAESTTMNMLATLENVRLRGNSTDGLRAQSGSLVTIRKSVSSHNGGNGLSVVTGMTGSSFLAVENCFIASNAGDGVLTQTSGAPSIAAVSNSIIVDNVNGLNNSTGVYNYPLFSRGNNTILSSKATVGQIVTYSGQ